MQLCTNINKKAEAKPRFFCVWQMRGTEQIHFEFVPNTTRDMDLTICKVCVIIDTYGIYCIKFLKPDGFAVDDRSVN